MLDAVRPHVDELTTMVPKGTTEIVVASLGNDAGSGRRGDDGLPRRIGGVRPVRIRTLSCGGLFSAGGDAGAVAVVRPDS